MLSKDIKPWLRSELDWEILEEMDDLKDEIDLIFYKCMNEIQGAYWPVREIFRQTRWSLYYNL